MLGEEFHVSLIRSYCCVSLQKIYFIFFFCFSIVLYFFLSWTRYISYNVSQVWCFRYFVKVFHDLKWWWCHVQYIKWINIDDMKFSSHSFIHSFRICCCCCCCWCRWCFFFYFSSFLCLWWSLCLYSLFFCVSLMLPFISISSQTEATINAARKMTRKPLK